MEHKTQDSMLGLTLSGHNWKQFDFLCVHVPFDTNADKKKHTMSGQVYSIIGWTTAAVQIDKSDRQITDMLLFFCCSVVLHFSISDSPMPLDTLEHRPCRAAAEAGTLGGCIPQVDEAWILLDPVSELCSRRCAGAPGVPVERSGIGFPASIPLS